MTILLRLVLVAFGLALIFYSGDRYAAGTAGLVELISALIFGGAVAVLSGRPIIRALSRGPLGDLLERQEGSDMEGFWDHPLD